jgi:hypothetical protein
MAEKQISTASLANRRRARRCKVSSHARTECRKGSHGMGRNVAVTTLDLSETGARLIVRIGLAPGDEVEILLAGTGVPKPVKRVGTVVWSVLLPDACHAIGVVFDKALSYADLQRLARV